MCTLLTVNELWVYIDENRRSFNINCCNNPCTVYANLCSRSLSAITRKLLFTFSRFNVNNWVAYTLVHAAYSASHALILIYTYWHRHNIIQLFICLHRAIFYKWFLMYRLITFLNKWKLIRYFITEYWTLVGGS